MTEREIRRAVADGRGRAILFLREKADQAYFPLILELCRRDQAFDSLFENRCPYICRLADTLPNPDALVEPLGKRLFESKKRRARMQIREVLGHFRRKGNAEAREYLLKDFYRFRLKDRQFADAVNLLGFEGLELLVDQVHRLEAREIERLYNEAILAFGKRRTLSVFRKLAKTNSEAKRIISVEERVRPPKPIDENPSAAEWIDQLKTGRFVPRAQFATVATRAHWIEVAMLAMESFDDGFLRRAGSLLMGRVWPLDVEDAFVRALDEPNKLRRLLRMRMFDSTPSEYLRAWALQQLLEPKKIRQVWIAFKLLRLNAEFEDYPILAGALYRLRNDREAFHFAGLDVLWLRNKPTVEMLKLIFEYGPCDECRNSVVRKLIKRGQFTGAMRKECAEDSNEDTRKLTKLRAKTAPNPT